VWPRRYGRRKFARPAVRPGRARQSRCSVRSRRTPRDCSKGVRGQGKRLTRGRAAIWQGHVPTHLARPSTLRGDRSPGWSSRRFDEMRSDRIGSKSNPGNVGITAAGRRFACLSEVKRTTDRGGQAIGCWDWSAETVARLTLPAHRPGGLPGAFALACWKPRLEEGFALRCLQRLSFPDLATRRCPEQDSRYTRGRSSPILSY
jgi:hypothetical protein